MSSYDEGLDRKEREIAESGLEKIKEDIFQESLARVRHEASKDMCFLRTFKFVLEEMESLTCTDAVIWSTMQEVTSLGKRYAFAKNKTYAYKAGVSIRQVQNTMKLLKEIGFITELEDRRGGTTHYVVLTPLEAWQRIQRAPMCSSKQARQLLFGRKKGRTPQHARLLNMKRSELWAFCTPGIMDTEDYSVSLADEDEK